MYEERCPVCKEEIVWRSTSAFGRQSYSNGERHVCDPDKVTAYKASIKKSNKPNPAGYKAVAKEIRRKRVERERRAM